MLNPVSKEYHPIIVICINLLLGEKISQIRRGLSIRNGIFMDNSVFNSD